MKTFTQAVIFDIDGTLLDSNTQHAKSFEAAFSKLNKSVPYSDIRRLIGMEGKQLISRLLDLSEDAPEIQMIAKLKKEIFLSHYLHHLKPFDYAKELIQGIKNRGIKIAIATSATEDDLKNFLKIIQIDNDVDVRVSVNDIQAPKPAPDAIFSALNQLKLTADQAIMVGDTPYDIEAARGAKVKTIALRNDKFWADNQLHGAVAIYDNPLSVFKDLENIF